MRGHRHGKDAHKRLGFLTKQSGGGVDVTAFIKQSDEAAIDRGNSIVFSQKQLTDKLQVLAQRWGAKISVRS